MSIYPFITQQGNAGGKSLEEFTFKTEFNGGVSFAFTKSGAALNWDMGDGTVYMGVNSVFHVYADGTEKTVTVSGDDLSLITEAGSFFNKEITEVNFQDLDGLGGDFLFYSNPNLQLLNLPNSTNPFTRFEVFDCDLTGNVDLSGIILQGTFRIDSNSNLTGITFSSNATQFSTDFRVSFCDITGVLNLNGLKMQTGRFWAHQNFNMTSISFNADPTQVLTSTIIRETGIVGVVDFSNIDVSGSFEAHTNPTLTGILHKTTANLFARYWAYNTGITTLDLSPLQSLSGDIRLHTNASLSSLTFYSNITQQPSIISIHNCSSLTTLDLSGFININGGIVLHNNQAMTSYTFPPVMGTGSCAITIYENDALTSLDLSGVRLTNNNFFYRMDSLTSITFAASSDPITLLDIFENASLTSIDLSTLTFAATTTRIQVYQCASLTSFTPPTTAATIGSFSCYLTGGVGVFALENMSDYLNVDNHFTRLQNNSYSAAEVNEMLVKADSVAISNLGWTRSFQINNNAAPDNSSGGFDGVAAAASLTAKGFTVITN